MQHVQDLPMKHRSIICLTRCLFAAGVLTTLLGCSSKEDDPETHGIQKEATEQPERSGVTLSAEEIQNAGIEIKTAEADTYAPQAHGFAVVIAHDAIAQSVSDVITAEAAAAQSRVALTRVEGLAKAPGAFSAETIEGARRQAQADEAAHVLARRKLSASWGAQSPWGEDVHNDTLTKVASGKLQLIRVTFPFGSLSSAPRQLSFASLGSQDGSTSLSSSSIWNAPADASIPGRSLFALVPGSQFSEGERVDASAPVGNAVAGSVVPSSVIVIYDARTWCYVEGPTGHFERRAIDTRLSTSKGYFSETAIKPGDRVAVSGSALLLAREINPNTEADE
jgi:hypothetical protein